MTFKGSTQTMQINNLQACTGDTVNATIIMSAMDSLGAITLFIGYDTTKLKFINLININPLASGMMFNDMHSGGGNTGQLLGKIAITWVTSSLGINFGQGVFAELKFKVLGGGNNLQFLGNCEIANYESQTLNITYIDGSISAPLFPLIFNQPYLNIISSQNASITISSQNASSQNWQMKTGNSWVNIQNGIDFLGVDTDTLIINNFSSLINGTYFRCKLSTTCETIYTDSLFVITTGLPENKNNHYSVYPNPFTETIYIDHINSENITEIKISQVDGKTVRVTDLSNQNNKIVINNLNNLSKGFYFIEITSLTTDNRKDIQVYKLIKE